MQGGADALHAEQNMRRPTLDNHILCSLDAPVDSGSLDTLLNVILSLSRIHPTNCWYTCPRTASSGIYEASVDRQARSLRDCYLVLCGYQPA